MLLETSNAEIAHVDTRLLGAGLSDDVFQVAFSESGAHQLHSIPIRDGTCTARQAETAEWVHRPFPPTQTHKHSFVQTLQFVVVKFIHLFLKSLSSSWSSASSVHQFICGVRPTFQLSCAILSLISSLSTDFVLSAFGVWSHKRAI